jgi:predicted hydrocarbon binding protein
MDATAASYKEVAVPVSVFAALRGELAKEAGTLPTIHALHAAGYAAGIEAAAAFPTSAGEDVEAIPEEAFWARLSQFFSGRGWGTLSRDESPGPVGVLSSDDWAESSVPGAQDSEEASCSFSTGFLSGLLSQLSGGRMAVLEVSCRGRGDGRCSFAFGSESAIHELYGRLVEGDAFHQALEAL